MTVLASNFSGLRTKPESRCGRKPIVVRMTRSHEMRAIARLSASFGAEASGRAGADATRFGPHAPTPMAASAIPLVLSITRLFIAVSFRVSASHRPRCLPIDPEHELRETRETGLRRDRPESRGTEHRRGPHELRRVGRVQQLDAELPP